jgi:hypothetical protein
MSAGYPDKTPTSSPPVESVDVCRHRAPDAARFGKGTSTRQGAQQAQDAVREHSRELGNRRATPNK